MAEPTSSPAAADGAAAVPEPLVYRPLVLQAIIGFGIAALYAAVVLLGLVVALVAGSPWMMPVWTLLFPLAGVLLSLIARARIRTSEGTLAGSSLAGWGIALSAVFALIYLAHSGAVYLALRNQAGTFTDQWFKKLTEGDTETAFRWTIAPATRPAEGEGMRGRLEIAFNTPDEMSRKGMFSRFQQSDPVRYLRRAGSDADIRYQGMKSWDYLHGGYQVRQTYRVTTPEISFDLLVPVQEHRGPQGRQWQVLLDDSSGGGVQFARQPVLTPLGEQVQALQGEAQKFTDTWIEGIQKGRPEQAYLATRALSERQGLESAYHRGLSALPASAIGTAGGGMPALMDALARLGASREARLPGYADFTQGGLLAPKTEKFWPTGEAQAKVFDEVRSLFRRPEYGIAQALERDPYARTLEWSREQDRIQVRQDVRILLPARIQVEGVLLLECDAGALGSGSPPQWRVAGLELIRARALASPSPQRVPDVQQP